MEGGIGRMQGRGRPRRAGLIVVAAAALLLGGCGLTRQDGSDDEARTFDIPVRNAAHDGPPYTRVMGNPMPDSAWLRERASECEPWQLGDNGCAPDEAPGPVRIVRAASASPKVVAPATRPRRARPHETRKQDCYCAPTK